MCEDGKGTTGAQTGLMQPWAKWRQGSLTPPEAGKKWEGILSQVSEAAWVCQQLNFGYLVSRTVRNKFMLFYFIFGHAAYRMWILTLGLNPHKESVKSNHWTTREFPDFCCFKSAQFVVLYYSSCEDITFILPSPVHRLFTSSTFLNFTLSK